MERYGVNGRLMAKPGEGQALLRILLEASEAMTYVDDCFCYIVGMNPQEPDSVFCL